MRMWIIVRILAPCHDGGEQWKLNPTCWHPTRSTAFNAAILSNCLHGHQGLYIWGQRSARAARLAKGSNAEGPAEAIVGEEGLRGLIHVLHVLRAATYRLCHVAGRLLSIATTPEVSSDLQSCLATLCACVFADSCELHGYR